MKTTSRVFEIGGRVFDRERIIEALDEHVAMRERRTIRGNSGGTHAPHMFAAWYTAKLLSPDVIVESGIWKGQRTWLFEQACPSAMIHSIYEFFKREVRYYNFFCFVSLK